MTNRNFSFLLISSRAINPGGIRLGTPAVTTRGMVEKDMEVIADLLIRGIKVAKRIQDKVGK